jgi:hypothetical protein
MVSDGITSWGHPAGSQTLAAVSMIGGVLILLGIALHERVRAHYFEVAIMLIEGVASALTGMSAIQRGTSYIQYAWFTAAAAFLVGAVIRIRKTRPEPQIFEHELR